MSNEILAHHNQPGVLIPQYEGRVETFRHKDKIIPIHKGKTLWHFEDDGQKYQIPVFSIWAYENHNEIARLIAAGKVCAMYMWGTYGTGILINSPEWQRKQLNEKVSDQTKDHQPLTDAGKLRQVKQGRPADMPFVPFMYPDDMIDFWDT